jgi:hypothetical protein
MNQAASQVCVICNQEMTDDHKCPDVVMAKIQEAEVRVDQEGDVDYPDVIPGQVSQDDRYSDGFAMLNGEGSGGLFV